MRIFCSVKQTQESQLRKERVLEFSQPFARASARSVPSRHLVNSLFLLKVSGPVRNFTSLCFFLRANIRPGKSIWSEREIDFGNM
ncbi:hypothetical protein NL676_008702 [Syzygium grande]|nr:hypothetical protein NL676_008702 [Syzygium grande]